MKARIKEMTNLCLPMLIGYGALCGIKAGNGTLLSYMAGMTGGILAALGMFIVYLPFLVLIGFLRDKVRVALGYSPLLPDRHEPRRETRRIR